MGLPACPLTWLTESIRGGGGEKTHVGPSTKLGRWPQVFTDTNHLKQRCPPCPTCQHSDQAKCLHKGPSGLTPGDCPLASKKSKVCLQPALPAQLRLPPPAQTPKPAVRGRKGGGNQVKPDGKAVLLVSTGSWRAGSRKCCCQARQSGCWVRHSPAWGSPALACVL